MIRLQVFQHGKHLVYDRVCYSDEELRKHLALVAQPNIFVHCFDGKLLEGPFVIRFRSLGRS